MRRMVVGPIDRADVGHRLQRLLEAVQPGEHVGLGHAADAALEPHVRSPTSPGMIGVRRRMSW